MQSNFENLHLLLDRDSNQYYEGINFEQIRKKMPGNHIAVIDQRHHPLETISREFDSVYMIDIDFIQRISFSKLIGDENAFIVFKRQVERFSNTKWGRVINLTGSEVNNAIMGLLSADYFLGHEFDGNKSICNTPPLSLLRILKRYKVNTDIIEKILIQKSIKQLELADFEKTLNNLYLFKNKQKETPTKKIIIGVILSVQDEINLETLKCLDSYFTLIPQNEFSKGFFEKNEIQIDGQALSIAGINNFLDAVVTTEKKTNKSGHISISSNGIDEVIELFTSKLENTLEGWTMLSFIFEYVGSSKASLMCEKIMSTYQKKLVHEYLLKEISYLKSFVKIMLESTKSSSLPSNELISKFWEQNPCALTGVSAIEISQRKEIGSYLKTPQDIASLKTRLRSLNNHYERIFRSCTIELPKSDLSLVL
jgi:hypothetical protein